ncbi:MAG TPA: carbon monoxide dehydrogenase beta subunit family protein [Nitrospira sp.]|nr:carbon monoxide dehydrogenase beta subunit family protein [Nitrospira sp.]
MKSYEMTIGPEGYLPPSVSERGVIGASKGEGLVLGKRVSEQHAIDETARRLIHARNPTIFPGPLVLWAWSDQAVRESRAVKALAEAVPAKLIPMADYRPKYPKIVPEKEINPNHPNLTIWKNKIDVCLFVGVHCHQSNIALKIIRGGTDCFTIALCTFSGDDEAHITIRDLTAATIQRIVDSVHRQKRERPS